MENLFLTSLSTPELAGIFRKELETFFRENPIALADPDQRLTIVQLSEQYQISKPTIHSLMKSGKLSFEKIGRKTLFRKSDVEKYFQSNRRHLNKKTTATF